MNGSFQVVLNGSEVGAYVVEMADGMRVRLDVNDWECTGLGVGRRIPVRLSDKADEWLFVTHATEIPPLVWVVLAKRIEPQALTRRPQPLAAYVGRTPTRVMQGQRAAPK